MGANLIIRKPKKALMEKDDIQFMALNCPYCCISNFIKDSKEEDVKKIFEKHGKNSWRSISKEDLEKVLTEIPNGWLELNEVWLNNISYDHRSSMSKKLQLSHIPHSDMCSCDQLRQDCICEDSWLSPEELQKDVDRLLQENLDEEGQSDLLIFKSVAERGFECQWDS